MSFYNNIGFIDCILLLLFKNFGFWIGIFLYIINIIIGSLLFVG